MTSSDSLDPTGPKSEPAVKKVHLVLQAKGGVGKTLVASLIAQYLAEKGEPPLCFDVDPGNRSLSQIKALNAIEVPMFRQDDKSLLDIDKLDDLVEQLVQAPTHCVVDNGASGFIQFSSYLIDHDIPALLIGQGKPVVVHSVIAGGPQFMDTVRALESVLQAFPPEVDVIVWLNEKDGQIGNGSDRSFEDTQIYSQHRDRIRSVVKLAQLNPMTFGRNLSDMLSRRMTFAEADESSEFRMVARQRLRQVKRPIWDQMEQAV